MQKVVLPLPLGGRPVSMNPAGHPAEPPEKPCVWFPLSASASLEIAPIMFHAHRMHGYAVREDAMLPAGHW